MCVERSDKQTGNARCRASVGLKRVIFLLRTTVKRANACSGELYIKFKTIRVAISYWVELSKSLTLTWRTQNWV